MIEWAEKVANAPKVCKICLDYKSLQGAIEKTGPNMNRVALWTSNMTSLKVLWVWWQESLYFCLQCSAWFYIIFVGSLLIICPSGCSFGNSELQSLPNVSSRWQHGVLKRHWTLLLRSFRDINYCPFQKGSHNNVQLSYFRQALRWICL